jgi:hypothetical protein
VIREDRELLTELARLNRAMAPFAMRIMEDTATADEQHDFARRLIAAGQWLQRRADPMRRTVVDGEVVASAPLRLPGLSIEPAWES